MTVLAVALIVGASYIVVSIPYAIAFIKGRWLQYSRQKAWDKTMARLTTRQENGTQGRPFQSLQDAVNVAVAGNVIYVQTTDTELSQIPTAAELNEQWNLKEGQDA